MAFQCRDTRLMAWPVQLQPTHNQCDAKGPDVSRGVVPGTTMDEGQGRQGTSWLSILQTQKNSPCNGCGSLTSSLHEAEWLQVMPKQHAVSPAAAAVHTCEVLQHSSEPCLSPLARLPAWLDIVMDGWQAPRALPDTAALP